MTDGDHTGASGATATAASSAALDGVVVLGRPLGGAGNDDEGQPRQTTTTTSSLAGGGGATINVAKDDGSAGQRQAAPAAATGASSSKGPAANGVASPFQVHRSAAHESQEAGDAEERLALGESRTAEKTTTTGGKTMAAAVAGPSAAAGNGRGGEKGSRESSSSSSAKKPAESPKTEDDDDDGDDGDKEKEPDGGYDSTPLPRHPHPTYTLRFTFHRATHLPIADLQNAASDPYLLVQLNMPHDSGIGQRHKQDPPLRWRSITKHATRDPVWEDQWVVAGVPAPQDGQTGACELKIRVMDEDKSDHDDRLGDVKIRLDGLGTSRWKDVREGVYEVQKRKAKKRVNLVRFCCAPMDLLARPKRGRKSPKEQLVVSIEVLGKTEGDDEVGKAYTIGPLRWRQHYSPMIGRVAGTEQPKEEEHQEEKPEQQGETEQYDFQANQLQLRGPVPPELYHRFVDFKSFVHGMFESTGVRGRVLHKALKYQHAQLYRFDKRTETGVVDESQDDRALARRFLELAHWDEGGRIFTYVVTLDGLLRFTETGKEFGIDLLSKHTMHSDVNVYIAWSGEFLIRRLAQPGTEAAGTHPADDLPGGPPHEAPPKDPEHYELIIDNDSGTYRPNADLIPIFQKFLERNFCGLKIRVFNGFDKELEKIKAAQLDIKHREGDKRTFVQDGSDDGLSSSDEEELEKRARGNKGKKKGGLGKAVAGLEDPKGQLKNMGK